MLEKRNGIYYIPKKQQEERIAKRELLNKFEKSDIKKMSSAEKDDLLIEIVKHLGIIGGEE